MQGRNDVFLLSAYLRQCLREFYRDDAIKKELDMFEVGLMDELAREMQGVVGQDMKERMEFYHQDPANYLEMVDKYYTRLALYKLPDIVDRFIRLAPIYV